MKYTYKTTITACFTGYVVQAIINNFAPLLFITFNTSYGISLSSITALITVNFVVQLLVDLMSVRFIDRTGYRAGLILAHLCSALGMILLSLLPDILPSPFTGLLISVVVYAAGSGLLEVLVSPVMQSCPTANKEKAMSLLHSFYCWGHLGVILLSTLFFKLFSVARWQYLACIWALVPIANMLVFSKTPIASLIPDGKQGMSVKQLFSSSIFWYFMLLMICAGASEQSVSQWSSAFAEKGLGLSKTAGDLLGPAAFALMMGLSRMFFGKAGDRISLSAFMNASGVMCVCSYLLIALVPSPVCGVIGCALTGLSVGIMWPGSFSKAAAALPLGGTALFAMLALGGDIGCSVGPTLVGLVSSAAGDNLKLGILAGAAFPLMPLAAYAFIRLIKQRDRV